MLITKHLYHIPINEKAQWGPGTLQAKGYTLAQAIDKDGNPVHLAMVHEEISITLKNSQEVQLLEEITETPFGNWQMIKGYRQ